MERMKTRFIIAVTQRLADAADTAAKVDLIEELSDNLFNRWQELVSGGADENDAYTSALEDLGDVDELLAYLDTLGPEEELPKQDSTIREFTSGLLHGAEGIVRETVSQARDAVDQAAVIVRGVADKIKEKYPDGFKGKLYVHIDRDEDGDLDGQDGNADETAEIAETGDGTEESVREIAETENSENSETPEKTEKKDDGWSFTVGYNRNRGGFFCESGQRKPPVRRRVTETSLPSEGIRCIDIQMANGDVTVYLDDDANSDVRLDGEADNLDIRLGDDGTLSIRQGNTAASAFFLLRGLASEDIEVTIPRRFWECVQISSAHGDIEIGDGLEARNLMLQTSSGDITFHDASCTELVFESANGDLECGGTAGNVNAATSNGDISLSGTFGAVQTRTTNGDTEISGSVRELCASSASGDLEVNTEILPEKMELSTKSGDCEVCMPGGQGFTLQFSTVSGDLESDFPLVGPIGSRSGEAMYLDGGGRTFRMSSVSGDLSLKQQ